VADRRGPKAGAQSDDVVVSNGPCALLYVKDREPGRIRKVVEFLQAQDRAA
jgi:hypothetical protein